MRGLRRYDEHRLAWCLQIVLLGACVLDSTPASAQSATSLLPRDLMEVVDPADRTGTNPANLRGTLDLWNDFQSDGNGLFSDLAVWQYAQAFSSRRMSARVELPLQLANVTGRTEAGFGNVVAGWEWLPSVRGRLAWLAGTDVEFDSATNQALGTNHTVIAPSAGFALAPRLDTVLSLRYSQRWSTNAVEDVPNIDEGTLETAIVRRFGDGTWIRGVPAAVFDYERNERWMRLEAEWGRVLTGGASTWVRAGGAVGASRPFNWSVVVGFRYVQ